MERNTEIIRHFYTAFANGDAKAMVSCYHPDIEFYDPVFGKLQGGDVSKMWAMLLERSQGKLAVVFSNITASDQSGSANWVASYEFSKTKRHAENRIMASFTFKNGLIIDHHDHFDFWRWSRQAFGFKGLILGWTPFMQNKIRQQARKSLLSYGQKSI